MHISMVIITLMSLRIVLGWVVERKNSFHIDSYWVKSELLKCPSSNFSPTFITYINNAHSKQQK